MTEINGHTYSAEQFPTYKTRARITIVGELVTKANIYTTQEDTNQIEEDLRSRLKNKSNLLYVEFYTTREQDDRVSELIEELFEK